MIRMRISYSYLRYENEEEKKYKDAIFVWRIVYHTIVGFVLVHLFYFFGRADFDG